MQQHSRSGRGRTNEITVVLDEADAGSELNEIGDYTTRDETQGRLSDDEVFEILYNRRRRDVLSYLRDHDGTSTVSDLAEYIAAKENDTSVSRLSSTERKRVYVGLYQNHLPMMDDIGIVDYDKNRGTVQLRECISQLEPYLEEDGDQTTAPAVVGGAVILAGIILLGVLDVSIFSLVPNLFWTIFGGIGLLGLTALRTFEVVHQ
ncbi:MAG: DUF7344 domain-containing protein [Natronomonas sp.]